MELTGHKKVDTLRHYDPLPENSVKIQRSIAIMGGKKHTASSTVVSGKAQSISTMAQVHNDANSRTSTVKTTVRDQR